MSRLLLPFAACLALALAGCDAPIVSIDGHAGVPLAQLDFAGRTARDITLLGPDTVHVIHGDTLAIRAEGDARAVAALRFVLNDGKLGIGRQPDTSAGNGTATITVTTPAVDHLVMAGSGTISSDRMAGNDVAVTIGGAGHVVTAGIEATQLAVEVLGSGSFSGSGHAEHLALTLAGSGDADLAQVRADDAQIDIAGTGTGALTSDGHVTGSVLGTGVVNVHGKAHCDIRVTGTGRVNCQP